ncbi:MAG: EamA family transporter [Pyrinomonadaceae bacterium]
MKNIRVIAAFACVYVIWGSTYLVIRYAIETIPPFLMMGVRSVIAGSVLYLWSRKASERILPRHWKPLLIIAILFFVCGHGLLAWAQKRVASGLAAVLIASDPLWIALIESFTIRGFQLSVKQKFGLLIGIAGITLMFIPDSSGIGKIDILGATIIIVSAVCWSIGAVYSKVAVIPKSASLTAGLQLVLGGVLLIVISFAAGELENFSLSAVSLRSALSLAYLIVFGSIITFTAYVWLLQVTSATKVATHTYVNPIIALILGSLFASEQFTITILIASLVIIVSVYLVLQRPRAQPVSTLR